MTHGLSPDDLARLRAAGVVVSIEGEDGEPVAVIEPAANGASPLHHAPSWLKRKKPARSVSPEHVEHLRTSGLSDETIGLSQWYTEDDRHELTKILGRTYLPQWGSSIVIPFFLPGATEPHGYRIRPDKPRTDTRNGKKRKRKYDQRQKADGGKQLVYFAPRSSANGGYRDASQLLVFTEGEKKALALDQLGYVTIGLTGVDLAHDVAAREREPSDWRLHPDIVEHVTITGRVCVIAFDQDAYTNPNIKKAAARLAEMLRAAGAAAVYLCLPSERSTAKGIDDVLAQQGEDAVHHIIANRPSEFALPVEREPQELPELPSVPAWDDTLLPEALRPWLLDVIERTQCPPEYVAVGALVSLASVIGRQCAIRPKRQDDWLVVPNLWAAIVGLPSWMKSPALAEAMRALRALASKAAQDHRDKTSAREELNARFEAAKKALHKAAAADEECTELRSKYDALRVEVAAAAVQRRFIVSDSTVEKLGEILNENPRGILLFRDELMGWLASLEREGHQSDRAFYLEAWAGTNAITYDRIGRGTIHIPAACVSVLGSIQPGPLSRYLTEAVSGGAGADGLMQRFQLLVYPDPPSKWRNVDRWPDSEARQQVLDLFNRLSNICPEDIGAWTNDDSGVPYLRFAADAQEAFDAWHEALMHRVRSGDEHAALEGHLIKYKSLMPSLALVFELAGGGTDFVRLPAAELAIRWCDMLEAHARRVYASVTAGEISTARALLNRIRAGKLPEVFSARDVYRHQWSGLTDAETVERGLEVLDAYGWVALTAEKTGGRPRLTATVHPSARAADGEP